MGKAQAFAEAFRAVEMSIRASEVAMHTIHGTAQYDEAMAKFDAWDKAADAALSIIYAQGLEVEYGKFAAEQWAEQDAMEV